MLFSENLEPASVLFRTFPFWFGLQNYKIVIITQCWYMAERQIGLVDEGELNFDQSLQFNVNKNMYAKSSSWFDNSINSINFTIVFLSEKYNFFKMQNPLCETYLFNLYLGKNLLCKRYEVNSEPTHFLIFMNNGKAFPTLDGIACSHQCSDQLQLLTRALASQKLLSFLRQSKTKFITK